MKGVLIWFLGVPIGCNVASKATHEVLERPHQQKKSRNPTDDVSLAGWSCEKNGESGILWYSPLMKPVVATQQERQQWFGIWVRSCTRIAAETRTSGEGPPPGGRGQLAV